MYCSSRACISKKVFSYQQDICCNKSDQFFKSSLCLYCNLYRCAATSDIASDCCYDNIAGYLGFLSVISQPWLVSQTVHVGVGWGGVGWVVVLVVKFCAVVSVVPYGKRRIKHANAKAM